MQSDFFDRPAFETIRPRRATTPLVFNSAHSGRDYPSRFLAMTALNQTQIRQSEDAFVDELFARAPHMGAPLLRANFPRAYLDVNREPWELDPEMFIGGLPQGINSTSPRVAAGLGTLARIVAENRPIYRERLTPADARMRIEGIYLPYHAALQKLLTEAIATFGATILVDCHSMPKISRRGDRPAPDIVLGDRYGTSCTPAVTDLAETVFAAAGLNVARNRPYAGGHVARTYGHPRHGVNVLQIEISRHLYMHEDNLRRHDGFAAMQHIAALLIGALSSLGAPALTTPPPALARAAQ